MSALTPHPAGYADAYPLYRDHGWAPIKLKAGTKFPPPTGFTGWDGVDPSGADMAAWAEQEPGGNIALRLPADVIGIDADCYGDKTGAATLAEAEKRWGKLPYSPKSTSRDDGSGIRLYTIPAGTVLADRLGFPELGLGGVEIIQRHHRCVVCWPSVHGKTGRTYRWLGIDGPLDAPPHYPDDLPPLPDAWLAALTAPEGHNGADGPDAPYDGPSVITEGEPSPRVLFKLADAMALLYGSGCRHDGIRDAALGLLRLGKQGEPGVRAALKALQGAFATVVGPDRPGGRSEAIDEFRGFIFRKLPGGQWKWELNEKVARLLADDSYDERPHDPGEPPPDADDHHTGEYTPGGVDAEVDQRGGNEEPDATTWEPFDLRPYLQGQVERPTPSVGLARSDGLKLIYPGKEHAVLGETESGKTWFALGCVAAELTAGGGVVYIHYEEGDPSSTIERLQLLGVAPSLIAERLRFVAPGRPARTEWVAELVKFAPTLVVHDGVNEAMSLIGADIMAADGAATFRRRLVTPFLRVGAASIACDHLPKDRDGRSRDAYGSVHKGNALDGARYVLENDEPFGRRMRGVSYVFVTKDRPGALRANGRPTKLPGKTFVGTLMVDDSETYGPDFAMRLFAPKDGDNDERPTGLTVTAAELADAMHEVIAAQPDQTVGSLRKLNAQMRAAGHAFRNTAYRNTVDDLITAGRVVEVAGRRGAVGYRAVGTASGEESS